MFAEKLTEILMWQNQPLEYKVLVGNDTPAVECAWPCDGKSAFLDSCRLVTRLAEDTVLFESHRMVLVTSPR